MIKNENGGGGVCVYTSHWQKNISKEILGTKGIQSSGPILPLRYADVSTYAPG